MATALKRTNSQTSGDAQPPDNESKKIDVAAKKVAAQSANNWRIVNSIDLLSHYGRVDYPLRPPLHIITHIPKHPLTEDITKLLQGQQLTRQRRFYQSYCKCLLTLTYLQSPPLRLHLLGNDFNNSFPYGRPLPPTSGCWILSNMVVASKHSTSQTQSAHRHISSFSGRQSKLFYKKE